MDRLAVGAGGRDRQQSVGADEHRGAARRVQRPRHLRVGIRQDELRLVLEQQCLATRLHVRHQLDRPDARVRFQPAQPAGQEGERQRVRGREAQGRGACVRKCLRFAGKLGDLGQKFLRDLAKPLAGLGESRRLRGAVEELRAEPFLERADAAGEGWLGHVPLVGGAGKVADGRQRQEVLKPGKVHGDAFTAWKDRKTALAGAGGSRDIHGIPTLRVPPHRATLRRRRARSPARTSPP